MAFWKRYATWNEFIEALFIEMKKRSGGFDLAKLVADTIDQTTGSGILLVKRFTSTPAVGDMTLGEIAIGEVSNVGYIYVKARSTEIISIKDDGTFSIIS